MRRETTLDDLLKHLERFGPEGILESATHLGENEYQRLTEAVQKEKRKRAAARK